MRVKIKLNESRTKLYEDDTLPPQSSPSKPPGDMKGDRKERVIDNIMRYFKGLFSKTMKIPEENVTPEKIETLIKTPSMQEFYNALKRETDLKIARDVADDIRFLTVKDLGDEQKIIDFDYEEFAPSQEPADELDPDDPFYNLQEIAKRHFK